MRTNVKHAWIAFCAVLAMTLMLGGSGSVPSGTWAPTGSLSAVRDGAAAVALSDGRVLVIGGAKANGVPQNTVDIYSGGAFSAGPAMSIARKGHTATVLDDGRVLVAGGTTNGGAATGSAEIFDPAANSWSNADPLNEARSGAAAVSLRDGTVLVAGGSGLSGPLSSIEIYDAAADSWSVAGNMSTARVNAAAATLARWPTKGNQLIDRQVIIVGGSNGSSALSSTDIYDPETGDITAGPSLPGPRQNASAVTVLGGSVYVAGGNNGSADLSSAVLIGRDGSVSAAANLLAPRSGQIAVRLAGNNSVLIAGGSAASAEIFVPWSNTQIATGAPASAHAGGSSASAGQGLYLVAGGSGSSASELYGYATVGTDKNDYIPGESVSVSGSGWTAGETVALVLHEDVDPPVHADVVGSATADANGNISASNFYTIDPHDLGTRFFLTATGGTSNWVARKTFTDAPSADLGQCRTGKFDDPSDCNTGAYGDSPNTGWVNGNAGEQDAHYVEGYAIGYHLEMNQVPQNDIDIFLQYDTKHSDHVAIDFLTHYQCLEPHAAFGHAAETITPPDDTAREGEGPSDGFEFPIPAPSNLTAANNPGAPNPDGGLADCINGNKMTAWGATILAIDYTNPNACEGVPSTTNMQGSFADGVSISSQYIRVQIHPTSTDVVLGWGGHIASRTDWGFFPAPNDDDPRSAGGIQGSPYHMALTQWCNAGTGTKVTNLGQQDRSLSAAAVITPATKRGIKFNDLNANGVQDGGEPGLSGWTIKMFRDVDSSDTLNAGDTLVGSFVTSDGTVMGPSGFLLPLGGYEFQVFAGDYIVCEVLQNGWTQSSPSNTVCADDAGFGGNLASGGWAVTLANADEDLDNHFGNFARVTIKVKKVMIGGTDTFNYTGHPAGSISVNNGTIMEDVAPGQYTSTETVPTGWDLTSISCDDNNSTGSVGTATATFNVEVGEGTITCTFTNTKRGSIKIIKDAIPDAPQNFAYTSTSDQTTTIGSFNLDDDGLGGGDAACTGGNCLMMQTFSNLKPGAYTVTETLPVANWALTNLVCNSTGSGTSDSENIVTGVATITLGAGGSVECTYTNVKPRAKISIAQDDTNEVNDPHTFTATVEVDSGSGYGPAPDGTTINFSLVNSNGATAEFQPDPPGGDTFSCNTSGGTGSCQATINSSTSGTVVVTASADVTVLGVLFNLTTDSSGDSSGPATKIYVGASIALSPLDDTNPIGQPHDIKVTVLIDEGEGDGFVAAPDGTVVDFTLVNSDGATAEFQPDPPGGDTTSCTIAGGAGMCTVTINSPTPGTVTINASVTVVVSGVSLTRDTDPSTSEIGAGPDGTGPAVKHYVAGNIIVIKECEPALDPQLFTFSGPGAISGAQLACFTNGHSNNVDSGPLAPGNYNVEETVPANWDLTSVTCDDDDGTNPRSNPAALVLQADETITCTFHNVKRGKITIVKQISFGDPTAVFPFDATGGTDPAYADFSLDVNADPTFSDMNMQTLKAGSYMAQELISSVQGGTWEIDFINHPTDAISCTADGGSSFTITGASVSPTDAYQKGDDKVNITLGAGGDVTCTFINRSGGKIRIIKACLPDPDDPTNGMFNFTATYVNGDTTPGPLECSGSDPTNNNLVNDTLSLWQPVNDNVNGTPYTVGEVLADLATMAPGFSLTDISCVVESTNGTPDGVTPADATPNLGAGNVVIDLRGGQVIACTFTNTLQTGEGCTPGFWKNHAGLGPGPQTNAWPAPYTPGTLLSSVFTIPSCVSDANPKFLTDTLFQALSYKGGSGINGAAQILFRAAVAALLNAASPDVDYPLSTAEVISQVNTALASCDRNTILTLAGELDADNNLGCPINGRSAGVIVGILDTSAPAEVPDTSGTTNMSTTTSKPASKPIASTDNPVGLGVGVFPAAVSPSAAPETAEKEVSQITSVKLAGNQVEVSGLVLDDSGNSLTGVVGVTFALYSDREGGSPIWLETRNVELDAEGHYTVRITLPSGLGSLESNWLGAQVQGQAEQLRLVLR